MKILKLHDWDVDYREAREIQESLRDRLTLKSPRKQLRFVAGADVSYEKRGDIHHAGFVVWDVVERAVVESRGASARIDFPYVPGLLSFRETPALLLAAEKIESRVDAIMMDGHGISHPRGFGVASHLALLLGVPGVGCAKSLLVGEHGEVGSKRGDTTDLTIEGRRVGVVLRTKDNVKPLYISPGNMIDVDGAVELVLACGGGYRQPEPTRLAHLFVNKLRRESAEK